MVFLFTLPSFYRPFFPSFSACVFLCFVEQVASAHAQNPPYNKMIVYNFEKGQQDLSRISFFNLVLIDTQNGTYDIHITTQQTHSHFIYKVSFYVHHSISIVQTPLSLILILEFNPLILLVGSRERFGIFSTSSLKCRRARIKIHDINIREYSPHLYFIRKIIKHKRNTGVLPSLFRRQSASTGRKGLLTVCSGSQSVELTDAGCLLCESVLLSLWIPVHSLCSVLHSKGNVGTHSR